MLELPDEEDDGVFGRSCKLYWGCHDEESMPWKDRMEDWDKRGVEVVPVLSQPSKRNIVHVFDRSSNCPASLSLSLSFPFFGTLKHDSSRTNRFLLFACSLMRNRAVAERVLQICLTTDQLSPGSHLTYSVYGTGVEYDILLKRPSMLLRRNRSPICTWAGIFLSQLRSSFVARPSNPPGSNAA